MWRSLWRSGCFGLMCLVWLTSVTVGQSLHEIQTSLQGLDAAFVLNDLRTGAFLRLNEPRCAERFAPFATLEISVALAALDTRIVRNLDLVTPWNQLKYPLRATDAWELTHWTEDQTLRSAFTDSVEWYWWETAERLGPSRLRKALNKFAYGNQSLPAKLADSWQDDALRISAQEQATFLQALLQETLPVSATWQRDLKGLLLRERGTDYRLYLKTGSGLLQSSHYLGWSIGWLETSDGLWVFALNLTHRDLAVVKEAILQLPKRILQAAGNWPKTDLER